MPTLLSRRDFAVGMALATLASPAVARRPDNLRFLLNSGYSGAQAWFFLAEDRQHFARRGLAPRFTAGLGAYKAAPRMAAERFDAAFGDVYSLVDVIASAPAGADDHLPLAVYAMFNRSPCTIIVNSAGPIRTPQDLAGRRLIGHDRDVALETFPAYARAAAVDPGEVQTSTRDATMGAMLKAMLAGEVDGVFGYVTTATAHAATSKIPMDRLRFLRFADLLPDHYGHVLMVSRRMARERPAAVRALVFAVNEGVRETVANRAAGISAVVRRDSGLDVAVERRRLDGTLDGDMSHPQLRALGIGAIDPGRLQRSVALHASTKGMARPPPLDEVFTPRFLPPLSQRIFRV